ncbi:MAG: acyl-CoA thioesterase [Chloroflexales bacterium]|nr:acyl-CoA thioesterase [Chloroflexales bacterium]
MGGDLTAITTLRARYAETDAQGIVHHSSYIVWFELGRVELLRAHGISYRAMEAQGLAIVVSELAARYHAPARYDDLVQVQTALALVRSRQVAFNYRLSLADTGALLVTGRSTHIVVDKATGRPTRLPADLLTRMRKE